MGQLPPAITCCKFNTALCCSAAPEAPPLHSLPLRNDTEALVGYAEACSEQARLLRRHGGDGARASELLQQAFGAYNSALRQSGKLGRLEDRCDVRYNCACVCALMGAEQQAQQLLQQVAAAGVLSAADVAADEDLAGLRGSPWLQQLLAAAG